MQTAAVRREQSQWVKLEINNDHIHPQYNERGLAMERMTSEIQATKISFFYEYSVRI